MSQFATLESLIGRKSVILRRWLVRARCIPITYSCERTLFSWNLMAKYEIMVLACEVGLFHLTFTQINSEINCIAKNKYPDSQKLDTRCRGESFNACQAQRHVYLIFAFFLFYLFYVMQEKIQKILLSFWNSLILSNVCVIFGTRPIGDSTW